MSKFAVTMILLGSLAASWAGSLWSLQPLVQPVVPGQSANPIDAFIRAKLPETGLIFSPPADAATLRRRLAYD